jgi:excisionase family DNA binding protein
MMTVQQVAGQLRVSAQCVYTLVDEGLLQAVRIGSSRRIIRIKHAELGAFLDDCRIPATVARQSKPRTTTTPSAFQHLDSDSAAIVL